MKILFVIMLLLSVITGCSGKNNPNRQTQAEEGLKFAFSSGGNFILTHACTDKIDYLGPDEGGNDQIEITIKNDKQCFAHFDALINKNIGTQMTISFKGTHLVTATIQTSLSPSFRMGVEDKEQATSIINALKN
ncbi:hypothetical protein [Photorhabdus bodei]|uniref:Uncharacterized protein n=1 Tax=Photorhabdus bodei TaxID=2029681 RepID=A0ABX0ASQ2_9GAMM|nr:hypothetical protein [Photorhabdus bodei]NDK99514.1 hypothetical protein [Photorhabdus bodei]NDL03842.1 hypothetical protein [Photorhabdus bodei]NDL07893.1 hypothetical protein [Photorhabdus bodei]